MRRPHTTEEFDAVVAKMESNLEALLASVAFGRDGGRPKAPRDSLACQEQSRSLYRTRGTSIRRAERAEHGALLRHTRYSWLRNPRNLSDRQATRAAAHALCDRPRLPLDAQVRRGV